MAQKEKATGCSTLLNVKVEQSGESEISTGVPFNSDEIPAGERDTSLSIPRMVKEPAVNLETYIFARKKTTERSFMCELCGKKFLHSGHYKRHCKIHKASTRTRKKLKSATVHPNVNGRPKASTGRSFYDHSKQKLHKSDFSLTEHKQTINRSFVCMICDKGFGRNSHLKRHLKLHNDSDLLSVQQKQPRPQTAQVKSSILQATESDSDNSVTSVEYNDSTSSDNLIKQIGSPTEHKQTINRSFVCMICDKGFGRNSHLKRHLKLHNDSDSLSVQKNQPRPQTAQVKSSILQATESDSDNSGTSVEYKDSTSSDNLIKQVGFPIFVDPLEVTMVKSESSFSADVLDDVSVTDEFSDVVGSPPPEDIETKLLISNSCNALESPSKFPKICEAKLSKSLEDSEDFADDEVYVKMEQSDHSFASNESVKTEMSADSFVSKVIVEMINEDDTHSRDSLSVDMINHEMEKELFCNICGKKFGRKSHLTRHVKLHENTEIHECEICGKSFLQFAYLKAHVSTVHAEVKQELEKVYACPVCDKKFGRMSHLKRHMKLHVGGETYDCKVCGKKFLQNSNLKSHEKSHAELLTSIDEGLVKRHVDKRTNTEYFNCEQCGKSFQLISSLKAHINTVHIGNRIFDKSFECSFCGKEFGRNSHLKRHLKLHTGGKIFTCEICGRGFKQNGNLKAHIKMVHLKERPHQCTYCGKMFLQQSNLNTHIRTHTGEKPYGCTICGKNFTQGNQLKYHMLTHYGGTPFSCFFCGKSFTNNRNYQRHLKSHASDNPLECSVCFEFFGSEKEVKDHLREHRDCDLRGDRNLEGGEFGTDDENTSDTATYIKEESDVVSSKYDSRVDSHSEGGEFDIDDENTSDITTYIKVEPDDVVKEEPELYECASDYESTNESEALSSLVGDDVGQDTCNAGGEGIDYHDVVKSVNESIKDMTRNQTLVLEQTDEDPTGTSLSESRESLEGISVDGKPDFSDPLDGF